jgi:hypothetical protein
MLATGTNGLCPLRAATDEHCSTQRHLGRSNLYFASYGEGPVRIVRRYLMELNNGLQGRAGAKRRQAPREKSDKGRGTRIARSVPCRHVISATTGDLHDYRRLSCEQRLKVF